MGVTSQSLNQELQMPDNCQKGMLYYTIENAYQDDLCIKSMNPTMVDHQNLENMVIAV